MNLYNSEGYFDPTAYEALTRIEREEKKMQKINTYRPLVYICSPYRGDTEQNILNARKYSRFAVNSHYIPIAPHLLFTQFMDDTLGEDRRIAFFMNFVILTKCAELWVFGDRISNGMAEEIGWAKKRDMKIRYFTAELEEIL